MIDASRITFTEPDAPDEPGHLRLRTVTAMGWWKTRPHAQRYQVDSFPTLAQLPVRRSIENHNPVCSKRRRKTRPIRSRKRFIDKCEALGG